MGAGGGKGGQCVGLTTLPPSCADCPEIWKPHPPRTLWACPGLQWDYFTFYILPLREDSSAFMYRVLQTRQSA